MSKNRKTTGASRKYFYEQVARLANGVKLDKAQTERILLKAWREIGSQADNTFIWMAALALCNQKSEHLQNLGAGLLTSAWLAGNNNSLNDLSVFLETKRQNLRGVRILYRALLETSAASGDSMVMWNLYLEYRKTNPIKALAWLTAASNCDEQYKRELTKVKSKVKWSPKRRADFLEYSSQITKNSKISRKAPQALRRQS